MFKLILKDSEWLRGKLAYTPGGDADSWLLRVTDKRRCCLGVLGRTVGVNDEMMAEVSSFAESPNLTHRALCDKELSWLVQQGQVTDDSDDAGDLMNINDNAQITDAERLELMRPIFARHGIEIEFRENE